MKVLVGSPINEIKEYALWEHLTCTRSLTYHNYDLLYVDNSKNKEFHKKVIEFGVECLYVDPRGRSSRDVMTECNNLIRQRAIDGGYTHWVSIECDLYVVQDIIELLMMHDKNVVTCPYFIYTGTDTTLMVQDIEKKGDYKQTRNLEQIEGFVEFNGKLKQYFAGGLGCCMIKREVFLKIPFRVNEHEHGHADSFFYQDLYMQGGNMFVDFSIMPYHYNRSWIGISDNYKELRV